MGRPKKKAYTLEGLFDICPCKHESRKSCYCTGIDKVPEKELHFLLYLEGGKCTSGPNSFHGPMGAALTTGCYSKYIIAFDPIKEPDLPENVVKDLSKDKYLMYKYSRPVYSGILTLELASQKPWGIHHAWWLTLCFTALIDYTRDATPSPNKIRFNDYIQNV